MAKAKVTIRGVKEAKDGLINVINKQIKDPKFLSDIGKQTVDGIKNRTRGRLEEYKQPSLASPTTLESRERLIRGGNAFDRSIVRTEKTSNLSMSGQLLEALYFTVNQAQGVINIMLKSPRNAYRGLRKATLENKKNNQEIKDDLEERGRKFFFISQKLQANLESKIAQSLRKTISIYNRVRRKLS
jgi:hypothetical protein